jgi:hypothetical protein
LADRQRICLIKRLFNNISLTPEFIQYEENINNKSERSEKNSLWLIPKSGVGKKFYWGLVGLFSSDHELEGITRTSQYFKDY